MPVEIERKFLIRENIENLPISKSVSIRQAYLSTDPNKVIRVRTMNDKAFITIKGKISSMSKDEFEYPIPLNDAIILIEKYASEAISKTRHYIELDKQLWEVDEFHDLNNGLILAEAEIPSESHELKLPEWIKEEVTGNPKYYNSNIASHPFTTW